MDESVQPPVEHLIDLVVSASYEEAIVHLKRYEEADADDRKQALQALRRCAEDQPTAFTSIISALTSFLTDAERSIRLTAAKLFVAVAEADPEAAVPIVPSLADRLGDTDEFYYVRARSAEVLGYVALEKPDAVTSPEILADLRFGLSFAEPEVKEKLAKALEYVALGNPDRLRHHVSNLSEHLDDDNELVRYHLCTALVVIGCEHPKLLIEGQSALVTLLDDENAYVRGRAVEALGLLAMGDGCTSSFESRLTAVTDEEPFVTKRVSFAVSALGDGETLDDAPNEIGSIEEIR